MRNWQPWVFGALILAATGYVAVTQTATGRELLLEPETRRRYLRLKAALAARGVRLYTGSTRRTLAQQAAILARGASASSVSWHNTGRAVDAYPIDPATGKPDLAGRNKSLFRALHEEAAKLGFSGYAYRPYPSGPVRLIKTRKGQIWDGGHIHYPGPYETPLAALQATGAAVA